MREREREREIYSGSHLVGSLYCSLSSLSLSAPIALSLDLSLAPTAIRSNNHKAIDYKHG
ncbi:hypothetical protein DPMN_163962, partial [Dreissena polymorpha]